MYVALVQTGPGWMAESDTEWAANKGSNMERQKENSEYLLVKHYSIKHSGWGNKTTNFLSA